MPYRPIEECGIVGDLHTVALVALDGTVDFMCLPEFDSPSVFAALLDDERGGRFELGPTLARPRLRQMYLPDSPVLLTRMMSEDGVAEISDFMPVEEAGVAHNLVRRAKTVRGELDFRMRCAPRFDYGRSGHRVERRSETELLFLPDEGVDLRLLSSHPLEIDGPDAVAELRLRAEESAWYVLEVAEEGVPSRCTGEAYGPEAFKRTLNFWRSWVRRSSYRGRWQEMVNRSAMTLKLLTSRPHGAIVASPTFGLPEQIGGVRNWDYRYTWIRDASFTLGALLKLGYLGEAAAFMRWIEDRCRELPSVPELQVMYRIDGGSDLPERTLEHFEGYRGSRPVRIGNGAARQLQLDIYGELLDAVAAYQHRAEAISHDLWRNLAPMVEWVCDNWRRADEGIWEVRGGRHHFLFSRLMCWVALDRGLAIARRGSLPAPVDRWRSTRDEIHREIWTRFWHDRDRHFVQHLETDATDAALLMMPLVGFVGPTDPRWLATLATIERELVEDSLVYRYRPDEAPDGLSGEEGTFSMCTFWFAECLARAGDVPKARLFFEKMLGYGNHLGLFAEELGPRGEHLGNFPQAFTHIGLINAAFALDERLRDER